MGEQNNISYRLRGYDSRSPKDKFKSQKSGYIYNIGGGLILLDCILMGSGAIPPLGMDIVPFFFLTAATIGVATFASVKILEYKAGQEFDKAHSVENVAAGNEKSLEFDPFDVRVSSTRFFKNEIYRGRKGLPTIQEGPNEGNACDGYRTDSEGAEAEGNPPESQPPQM